MLPWRHFDYKSLDEVKRDIQAIGCDLPVSDNFDILSSPIEIYGKTIKNRLAIQPMEGFDGAPDGTPSHLTARRYRRFSAGGAGLIWFESTGTTINMRTAPTMSAVTEKNVNVFKEIILEIKESASDGIPPFVVAQISNCGRGAFMDQASFTGMKTPSYIACENPYLPRQNTRILTDGEILGIIDDYVRTAALMKEAGFDCVDIRSCHGYLLSEMLSAFTREHSDFGGSFENRTRMLLTIVDRINAEVDIPLAVRITATDLVPYPYGFGMKEDSSMEPDFTEPLKLAKILFEKGVRLFNPSLGRNHAHHLQSPADHPNLRPNDHQFSAMAYFHGLAKLFKESLPQEAVVMAGTFAFAKQFSPYIAAGGIEAGDYDIAGYARSAFANPDFANEILKRGGLDPKKCCLTCGKCGEMIHMSHLYGNPVGCPVFDKEIYLPYYNRYDKTRIKPSIPPEKLYPLRLFELYPVQ